MVSTFKCGVLALVLFCTGCASSMFPNPRHTWSGAVSTNAESAAVWAHSGEIRLHAINGKPYVPHDDSWRTLKGEQDFDLLPGKYRFAVSMDFVGYTAVGGVAVAMPGIRSDGTTDICIEIGAGRDYRLRSNYIDDRLQFYVAVSPKGETFSERGARLHSGDNGNLIGSELSCEGFD